MLKYGGTKLSTKIENNLISVSIDLCRDYTQIAYCMGNMAEPDSVSTIAGEQKYLIPTEIGKLNNSDEWCIGDDALLREKNGEAMLADDILKTILSEKSIVVGDNTYTGYEVLKHFFEGLFKILKSNYHIVQPDYISVTVEYPDRILVNLIRNVLNDMGYDREHVKIIGHSESIIYYMISQKKEIWVNDVLIFDFTKHQFLVRLLTTVRARVPQPIIVEEMDMTQKFKVSDLQTEQGRLEMDTKFLELLKKLCSKHIVSAVFLTGVGFYEKWMEDSIRFLCSKRRVFQGYNLFVKGAGYANLSQIGVGNADSYQFVCSGRTLVNIEVEVEKDDKNIPVILSKAGTNWYEAGARAEGILDDSKELRLRIVSSLSKSEKEIVIDLRGFPPRPNKTTRIEIVLAYRNDRQCIVVVKDLGFGDFFKSSEEMVKKVIDIEDYL